MTKLVNYKGVSRIVGIQPADFPKWLGGIRDFPKSFIDPQNKKCWDKEAIEIWVKDHKEELSQAEDKTFLSYRDVAALLRIKHTSFYNYFYATKDFPNAIKRGGKNFWHRADIMRWVEDHKKTDLDPSLDSKKASEPISDTKTTLDGKNFWTSKEVADYLGIALTVLYVIRKGMNFPTPKELGKALLFDPVQIKEWDNANKLLPSEPRFVESFLKPQEIHYWIRLRILLGGNIAKAVAQYNEYSQHKTGVALTLKDEGFNPDECFSALDFPPPMDKDGFYMCAVPYAWMETHRDQSNPEAHA